MCLKPAIKFPCGCLLSGVGPDGFERAKIIDNLPVTRYCRLKDEDRHSRYCVTDTSVTVLYSQRCLHCDAKFEKLWKETKSRAKRAVVDVVTRETGPHATGGFSPNDMFQFYREVTAEVEQKVQELWNAFRDEKAKVLACWWEEVEVLKGDPKEAEHRSSTGRLCTPPPPPPGHLKLELPAMDYDKHLEKFRQTLDDYVAMFDM